MIEVINPAKDELLRAIPEFTREHILDKIKQQKVAQKKWAKVPLEERLAILVRYGKLVDERRNELAELLSSEMGKPIKQSLGEIKGAAGRISHIAKEGNKYLTTEIAREEGDMIEYINYEPLGVVANISAWNYPYNVGYNVFIYALAAGNAVAYKPSEYTTLTGLEFERNFKNAGLPENLFVTYPGAQETGKALLEADLDGYFFTGSYNTGQKIATSIAHKLVPLQLELGGKDPLYVMKQVKDIAWAAKSAASGAFYNAGQSCCSVERIYIHKDVYDAFVEAFVDEVRSFKVGDPFDNQTFIGPLARKEQVEVLEDQVNDALHKGAQIVLGGKKIDGKGYFFEPTVLVNVNHTMSVMREESFGPIIGLQKVNSDEEALQLMNDTEYGLTAAIYSDELHKAEDLMKELDTGTVYFNCCDRISPYLPWSGRKKSGTGSTLSHFGIRAFTRPKAYQVKK